MKRLLYIAAALMALSLDADAANVSGTVKAEGVPVKGVKVTDGRSFVKTDAKGRYTIVTNDDAEYVYLTVPAGYNMASALNGQPLFYYKLTKAAKQKADFALVPTGADETRHQFHVYADVQVYNRSEIDLVKKAAADSKVVNEEAGVPAFGVSCGDILGEWDQDYAGDIHGACAEAGFPFYALMGNHDYQYGAQTNEASKQNYKQYFGPTYYSWDKGLVHYVVLDDVFNFGRHYMGYLEENQLEWFKKDLSDVKKGSTVVVFMHIPTYSIPARKGNWREEEYNKIVVNRQALYDILKPYKAHLCTAHEHYAENYVLSDNLFEHVHAPLSGLFWQSLLSWDGIPWGYTVYEVDGRDITWYYKPVEGTRQDMFTAYRVGADAMKRDCIVANVWNYDPAWKVEWSEDGKPQGAMTQYRGWDRSIVEDVDNRREKEFHWKYIGAGPTEHLFYARPSSPDADVEITVTDRFGVSRTWSSKREQYGEAIPDAPEVSAPAGQPVFIGTDRNETHLYNLALAEMLLDSEADGTWRTGESWGGVWTRDISYSAILSLAHLDPERTRTSLMCKVDRKGRIIQDTGTGGSWPCSTDREIWTVAAWEVYLETGDKAWLEQLYKIGIKSVDADIETVLDNATGLWKGESSFIDWREQSYPKWMQPADIAASECLGTNAVFFRTLRVLADAAGLLGKDMEAKKYADLAEATRKAINDRLWNDGRGLYGQYLYGRANQVLSPRSETLGESLCMLWGVADSLRTASIFRNLPVSPYGPTIFEPQIGAMGSYHNNAVWPFVTSFYGLAAARSGNRDALLKALASNARAAATFGSNRENMVASDGSMATVLNSRRQLWSVAGYLGLYNGALFGIDYTPDGIRFAPCVPVPMKGLRTLKGLKYRNMTLDISICGEGTLIHHFKLDGVETEPFVSASLEGNHVIEMEMRPDWYAEEIPVSVQEVQFDLAVPQVTAEGDILKWSPVAGAGYYKIVFNGKEMTSVADTSFAVTGAGEYAVIARSENRYSFMSEPVFMKTEVQEAEGSFSLSTKKGSQARFSKKLKAGEYLLVFEYANGNGDPSTFNKCSNRSLYVDGKKVGTVVFPQRGDDWSAMGYTQPVRVSLKNGNHTFELKFADENVNMNIDVDNAQVNNLQIINIK